MCGEIFGERAFVERAFVERGLPCPKCCASLAQSTKEIAADRGVRGDLLGGAVRLCAVACIALYSSVGARGYSADLFGAFGTHAVWNINFSCILAGFPAGSLHAIGVLTVRAGWAVVGTIAAKGRRASIGTVGRLARRARSTIFFCCGSARKSKQGCEK